MQVFYYTILDYEVTILNKDSVINRLKLLIKQVRGMMLL